MTWKVPNEESMNEKRRHRRTACGIQGDRRWRPQLKRPYGRFRGGLLLSYYPHGYLTPFFHDFSGAVFIFSRCFSCFCFSFTWHRSNGSHGTIYRVKSKSGVDKVMPMVTSRSSSHKIYTLGEPPFPGLFASRVKANHSLVTACKKTFWSYRELSL
jgi:hypothetical protein